MGSIFAFDDQLKWATAQTLTNATFTSASFSVGYHENLCCLFDAASATGGQVFTVNVYDGTTASAFGTNPIAMYTFTGGAVTGVTAGAPYTHKIPFTMTVGRPFLRVTVVAPAAGTVVFEGWFGENNTQPFADQYNV